MRVPRRRYEASTPRSSARPESDAPPLAAQSLHPATRAPTARATLHHRTRDETDLGCDPLHWWIVVPAVSLFSSSGIRDSTISIDCVIGYASLHEAGSDFL